MQIGQHLTAIADTQRKNYRAREERGELLSRARALNRIDLAQPLAGTQHVAVGKSAAGHQTVEIGYVTRPAMMSLMWTSTAAKPARSKAAAISISTVDALLAQDNYPRTRAFGVNGAATSSAGSKLSRTLKPGSVGSQAASNASRAQSGWSRSACSR